MATPVACKGFPPEIWLNVVRSLRDLEYSNDLIWLWLGGRHISRLFRSGIDDIFETLHLPRTTLYCNLGVHMRSWEIFTSHEYQRLAYGTSPTFEYDPARLILDRMDNNSNAIFKVASSGRAGQDIVLRRCREKSLIGAPVVAIQIRGIINDSGLPDLHINGKDKTITFDWKGMFTQLFGEERIFNELSSQNLGCHLKPKAASRNLHETHRKMARRSRLQRECRARYDTHIFDHYVHSEHDSMSWLYQLRVQMYKEQCGEETANSILGPDIYDEEHAGWKQTASRSPGSVPRYIFLDGNDGIHDVPGSKPSTRDLFSKRIPDLSLGWPCYYDDEAFEKMPWSRRTDKIGRPDVTGENATAYPPHAVASSDAQHLEDDDD